MYGENSVTRTSGWTPVSKPKSCLITLFSEEHKGWSGRVSEKKKAGAKFTAPSRFTAAVDLDLCDGCETRLDRCFFDAIAMEDDVAQIDETECMGCGLCVVTCPTEALSLMEIRDEDFVPENRAV